jgi:hypothetical protein
MVVANLLVMWKAVASVLAEAPWRHGIEENDISSALRYVTTPDIVHTALQSMWAVAIVRRFRPEGTDMMVYYLSKRRRKKPATPEESDEEWDWSIDQSVEAVYANADAINLL